MAIITRHSMFHNIDGLDHEINHLLLEIDYITGKKVETLPPVEKVPEFSRFFIKQTDGSYKEYLKIDNAYQEKQW